MANNNWTFDEFGEALKALLLLASRKASLIAPDTTGLSEMDASVKEMNEVILPAWDKLSRAQKAGWIFGTAPDGSPLNRDGGRWTE